MFQFYGDLGQSRPAVSMSDIKQQGHIKHHSNISIGVQATATVILKPNSATARPVKSPHTGWRQTPW